MERSGCADVKRLEGNPALVVQPGQPGLVESRTIIAVKVIDPDNTLAPRQQRLSDMRPRNSGHAGYQEYHVNCPRSCAHGSSRDLPGRKWFEPPYGAGCAAPVALPVPSPASEADTTLSPTVIPSLAVSPPASSNVANTGPWLLI